MRDFQKPIRGSGDMPDHIMLSIRGDAATSMTVTWRTDVGNTAGYVLYQEDGSDAWLRCDAETDTFVSDIDRSSKRGRHV